MTQYACNFVPMYKSYIETKHENRDRLGPSEMERLVIYWHALILIQMLIPTEDLNRWKSKGPKSQYYCYYTIIIIITTTTDQLATSNTAAAAVLLLLHYYYYYYYYYWPTSYF